MRLHSFFSILLLCFSINSNAAEREAQQQCPRIISQSPYISEMLDYLGMGHCIVGVSRYSKRDLPRTGGILDPDVKAINALIPNLIITSDWSKENLFKVATLAGAKTIRLKSFSKMAQLEDNMRTILKAANWKGAKSKVASFAAAWRNKIKQVKGNDKKVLLLSSCSGAPYSFGLDTRLHDLFTLAGFKVVESKEKIRHIRPGNEVDNLSKLADKYQPELLIIFERRLKKQCQMITPKIPLRILSVDGTKFLHPNTSILEGLDILISKKQYWN